MILQRGIEAIRREAMRKTQEKLKVDLKVDRFHH